MAKAVMQIGYGWPQCDGGAVLLDCFSIIPFCCLEVAHQLMQAIRVWVCLVESKISHGGQFFVAARAPVGCLSRIPIRCRQSLQSLESSFMLSRFQECARHSNAKFSGSPRCEGRLDAGCDLSKLPVLERAVDVCFSAVPVGNVLSGSGSLRSRLCGCLRNASVLFGEKRKSQVGCRRIPILQVTRELLDFFAGGVGKLFEGGIAESGFAKTQEPLCLTYVDGNRFIPILKRGLHIFLDHSCFSATHQGTQIARVAPQFLIKFPNRLVHLSRA